MFGISERPMADARIARDLTAEPPGKKPTAT
jgi:hypothetical protein